MSGSWSQIQSTSNSAVGCGLLLCSQTEQSLKSGHRLVTPIVAKNKLIEVNLELRTADPVISADQPLLQVANSAVGQGDDRFGALAQFSCLRLHSRDVPIPGLVQTTRKTFQRIGVDGRTHGDMLLDKAIERGCLKIWDHGHSQSPRHCAAFLNGHQDQSGSTLFQLTTTAQTSLRTANPSFIDLHLSTQRLAGHIDSRSAQFVKHHPGRFVAAQFQLTLKQKRRNPTFISRHQVRCPKPQNQRYLRIVQNGVRSQRHLMSTLCALPESRHNVRTGTPAPRTLKSIRPTTGGQILPTGLFAGELPLEFSQTTGKRRPRHARILYVVYC